MEIIICPICDSERIKKFCEKNNYTLCVCHDCDLVFVWLIPDNLDEIYKKEYFKNSGRVKSFGYTNYDQDKEPMKKVFEFYLDKFAKLTLGRKIFDVGAATGYFLDLAKERGWQTAGIEISNYATDVAKARGHNVVCGQLPRLEISRKFNVVTMWDVLEHVDDPLIYLKKVNKMLVPGGWLAINTIDRGSLWAKLWGKHWHLILPPEHLFYYSKKNLKLLLEQSGFKIMEIKKIGKKFSLSYIFRMLYSWQNLKIWNRLERYFDKPFWRKLCVPINLRDNIFMVARKNDYYYK